MNIDVKIKPRSHNILFSSYPKLNNLLWIILYYFNINRLNICQRLLLIIFNYMKLVLLTFLIVFATSYSFDDYTSQFNKSYLSQE